MMTYKFAPEPNTWYVLSFEHSEMVLAVESASTADGANVCQQVSDGSRSQQWSFEEVEDGWYRLQARHSGKALGIAGQSTEVKTNLHQWEADDSHSQQWSVTASEGGYLLTSRHSGNTVTVADASTADGANVWQGRAKTKPHRRVHFTPVVEPEVKRWYTLVFAHSGKALAVSQLTKNAGSPVVQASLDDSPRQQWRFEHVDDYWYELRARHSDMALDVAAASIYDGAPIHQWSANHNQNQQFRLIPTIGGYLLKARHSGRLLDVEDASTAEGARVLQFGTESSPSRRVTITGHPDSTAFVPEPGAYYCISFCHSGKVLDVHRWEQQNGASIVQYENFENANQLFSFEEVETGWYLIRARHSGKVLDVVDSSTKAGRYIEQRTADPSKHSQQWKVVHGGKGDAYAIRSRHANLALAVEGSSLEDAGKVEQRGTGYQQQQRVHITRVCGALPDSPSQVLRFSSGDEPVRLPPSTLTNKNGTLTVELWLRPNAHTGTQTLVEVGDRKHKKSLVLQRRDNDIRLLYHHRNFDANEIIITATDAIEKNVWTHIAARMSFSQGVNGREGKARLYVDGEQAASADGSGNSWLEPDPAGTLLASRVLGECTIGGRRDGSEVFRGKVAEVRYWSEPRSQSDIAKYKNSRLRGDEDNLAAYYRFDKKVDGRMLDSSSKQRHAIAGAGTQLGTVHELALPSTTAAGIRTRSKLTREWLPKAVFDEDMCTVLAEGYGDLAGIESLTVDDIGKTSGDRVEATVYQLTLEPHDANGVPRGEGLMRVDLVADQVVIVDNDAGEPRLEIWESGKHPVRIPESGRVRLRFVATGPTCAMFYARHAAMPDSVRCAIYPDEGNSASMLQVTGDDLAEPADGRTSPIPPEDMSEPDAKIRKKNRDNDAKKVAAMIHKLARVGAPLEALAEYDEANQSAGSGGFWSDLEEVFEDLSDTFDDLDDAAEVVWDAAKDARSFVADNLDELLAEAKQVTPRMGVRAIRESMSKAISLDVVHSAVEELSNVVQLIGRTAEGYFRVVINTVNDAMEALGGFFKRVGATIKDFIDMLAGAFDWSKFQAKAENMYDRVVDAFTSAKATIQDERDSDRAAAITTEIEKIRSWADDDRTVGDITGIELPNVPGMETMEYVIDQVQSVLSAAQFELPFELPELPDLQATWLSDLQSVFPDDNFLTTDFTEMPADTLRDIVVVMWDKAGATTLGQPYTDFLGSVKTAVDGISGALQQRIDVPWLTEVIEQTILGGRELNLLRLFCLAAAIPVVIYEESQESGSELVSFGEEDQALKWTQFSLSVVNSMLTAVRSVKSTPQLAMVHGFLIMAQGAIECRQGDNSSDAASIGAGILNLVYGLLTGSRGLVEHTFAKKRNTGELTDSETADLDLLSFLVDIVLGTGYLGLGIHTLVVSESQEDDISGGVEVSYWIANGILGAVGLYASSAEEKVLENIIAGCNVVLNLGYTAKTIALEVT